MPYVLISSLVVAIILSIVFIALYAVEKKENNALKAPTLSANGLIPYGAIRPFVTNNTFPNFSQKINATSGGAARVLCVGDSVTEVGSGGLGGYGTYPYQLATMSSAVGCSEAFMGSHTDPRWVLSNSSMISTMATLAGNVITLTNSGDQLNYNPTMKTFGYTLWMMAGPNACDVQVVLSTTLFGENGTTTQNAITVPCYDASLASMTLRPFEVRSTATLKDSMYMTITPLPVSGRSAMLIGIEPLNADSVKMTTINAGLSGTTTNDVNNEQQPYSPLNIIRGLKPDLTIIMLGINDWYISKTPQSQFDTNLRTIVNAAQSGGGDVLLMTPPPSNTGFIPQPDQEAYVATILNVAASLNLPVFNQHALWKTYEITNGLDWMKDALHPNERGVQQIVNGLRYTLSI